MAPPDHDTVERIRREAEAAGLDFETEVAPRLFAHPGELFVNETYHVIRERVGPLWHLSIRSGRRSWREYQQIKNQLVGPENEGVELYPAQSRLTDLADQYHLWVSADEHFRFPFGFGPRRRTEGGTDNE
jgi:hypothetical protein